MTFQYELYEKEGFIMISFLQKLNFFDKSGK
jgi:hypothetical protein